MVHRALFRVIDLCTKYSTDPDVQARVVLHMLTQTHMRDLMWVVLLERPYSSRVLRTPS